MKVFWLVLIITLPLCGARGNERFPAGRASLGVLKFRDRTVQVDAGPVFTIVDVDGSLIAKDLDLAAFRVVLPGPMLAGETTASSTTCFVGNTLVGQTGPSPPHCGESDE